MKVMMVTEIYLPIWGGAENQLRQLIPHLQQRGCEIVIVTRRWHADWQRMDQVDGVRVVRLGIPGRSGLAKYVFVLELLRYLFVHGRNVDIFHSHGAVYMGALCSMMARLLGVKNIAKIASAGKILPFTQTVPGRMVLRLFKKTHAVIAMTDEIRSELESIQFSMEKVIRITNGVDTARFQPADEEERSRWRIANGLPQDCILVLFSSRLVFGKGLDVLIDAWATMHNTFDNCRLVVVGSGDDQYDSIEDAVKERVRDEEISNIIFYGATTRPEEILGIADIFVFPSRREGFPNALMEALAAGLPVLGSRIGGVLPLIDNRSTGLLFENEDHESLAENLKIMIGNLSVVRKYGENARMKMIGMYSFEKVAQEYTELYQSLTVC